MGNLYTCTINNKVYCETALWYSFLWYSFITVIINDCMTTFLTDSVDVTRIHFSSKLNLKQRSELGQFLTPAPIARFMAGKFSNLSGHVHLLDPGAGLGALTAAFVEQLLLTPNKIESCFITAYEVEATFLPSLQQCLVDCCAALVSN